MNIRYLLLLILFYATDVSAQISSVVFSFEDQLNLSTGSTNSITALPASDEADAVMDFEFDCNSTFWTINLAGDIRVWTMLGGAISGGELVQTGGGSGLAYCGGQGGQTFYCANYPETGIKRFIENVGWTIVPTDFPLLNNGGYGVNQYYFSLDNGILKTLHHFDEFTLSIVENLESGFYTTADVAVDSLGRAWVFKGDSNFITNKLCVYNAAGLIETYDINFNSAGTYGAFFLNDILYIGKTFSDSETPDAIIPVIISGNTAELGTPIDFPSDSFADMASCNGTSLSLIDRASLLNPEIAVYPNPTHGILNINTKETITELEILNSEGKVLQKHAPTSILDITNLPQQTYILKINTSNSTYSQLVIKK